MVYRLLLPLVASQAVLALTLFLLTTASVVESFMPPHPSYEDWVPVYEMRRQLNITYDYEPDHINPEYCRYLSEEKCREQDEGMGHAIAGRHGRRLNPSIGQFKVLVLLIRFSDHVDRVLPTRDYFESLFNGGIQPDVNKIGPIKDWFRYVSLGKYRVQFDVRDWYTTKETEAYYSKGASGLIGNDAIQEMFKPALDLVDASGINWNDGYISPWGMLNHLVIVNSGYGAEYGPLKCLSNEPPQNRIWSQGTASSQNGWLSKDFYQVNGFAIGSAFVTPTCNGNTVVAPTSGNGVFQHEMGHGFGLPDLYDQDKNAPKLNLLGGIGRFDIMCNAHGWSLDTFISGQMSPYTRIYNTSWVDPILIVEDGYYAIQPSEISGQIYKITHNFPAGEYLLIENRQPIKWDSDWTASGIIIYHIDEAKPNQKTRGWPGSPGWPANHFRVSVIPSDGLYEIEQGINMGDQGDFWVNGQVLGPGPKFPNTDSIQHGIQKATGVTISVLSDSGFIMTFQVQGIGGSRTKRVGSVGGTGRQGQGQSDPNTTGNVLVWILSMLGGVAAMLGIVIILL